MAFNFIAPIYWQNSRWTFIDQSFFQRISSEFLQKMQKLCDSIFFELQVILLRLFKVQCVTIVAQIAHLCYLICLLVICSFLFVFFLLFECELKNQNLELFPLSRDWLLLCALSNFKFVSFFLISSKSSTPLLPNI